MGKRKPGNAASAGNSKQGVAMGPIIVAMAIVAGAIIVPSLYAGEDTDIRVEALPDELRVLLRCAEMCAKGPTKEDRAFAKRAPAHVRTMIEQDLTRACVMRCEGGLKGDSEQAGVPALESYTRIPLMVRDYRRKAHPCISAGVRTVEEIPAALKECGVVHLPIGSLANATLLRELQDAYARVRGNAVEYAARASEGNLRAGRVEVWPAFEHPFNAPELLLPPALLAALHSFLGKSAVLDHVSVIVSTAESTEPQRLHSDVIHAHRHLEIHMPLVDVTEEMGPTVYCPASHGWVQKSKGSPGAVAHALEQWYFLQANCQKDSNLSYTFPLQAGQVTIYDSNVWHAGSPNVAGVERPVLQLSWAADAAAAEARDYFADTFGKDTVKQQAVFADVEAFRHATPRR